MCYLSEIVRDCGSLLLSRVFVEMKLHVFVASLEVVFGGRVIGSLLIFELLKDVSVFERVKKGGEHSGDSCVHLYQFGVYSCVLQAIRCCVSVGCLKSCLKNAHFGFKSKFPIGIKEFLL